MSPFVPFYSGDADLAPFLSLRDPDCLPLFDQYCLHWMESVDTINQMTAYTLSFCLWWNISTFDLLRAVTAVMWVTVWRTRGCVGTWSSHTEVTLRCPPQHRQPRLLAGFWWNVGRYWTRCLMRVKLLRAGSHGFLGKQVILHKRNQNKIVFLDRRILFPYTLLPTFGFDN